jgi:hypothetical protein
MLREAYSRFKQFGFKTITVTDLSCNITESGQGLGKLILTLRLQIVQQCAHHFHFQRFPVSHYPDRHGGAGLTTEQRARLFLIHTGNGNPIYRRQYITRHNTGLTGGHIRTYT